MRTSVVALRRDMSDTINRVTFDKERVILKRNGKDVLALVSMEDLAMLEEMEDQADLRAARAARKEKGEIPWESIKAGLAARRSKARKLNAARAKKG